MDELISRKAVQEMVDRIGGMYPYRQIGNRESYSQYNEAWTDAINRVDAELNSLPSAEPEKRTEERTKTHACDLIKRQDVIDTLSVGREILSRVLDEADVVGTEREKFSFGLGLIESSIKDIEELPSAEPEWEEMLVICDNCGHAIHVRRR